MLSTNKNIITTALWHEDGDEMKWYVESTQGWFTDYPDKNFPENINHLYKYVIHGTVTRSVLLYIKCVIVWAIPYTNSPQLHQE